VPIGLSVPSSSPLEHAGSKPTSDTKIRTLVDRFITTLSKCDICTVLAAFAREANPRSNPRHSRRKPQTH